MCGKRGKERSVVVEFPYPGQPRVLASAHETHRIWRLGNDVYFCAVWKQVKDLALRCAPPTVSGDRSLRKLKAGIDPSSGVEVGPPFPVH
eukprot:6339126-Pyramimonas_sp.AAC.1